jgi:DNA-binding NarL/FixJ family response regulator
MTNKKIKVIIADDHDLFRDGLRMLLESDPEIDVCAEARNGEQLVQLANQHRPDVILTDLIMPVKTGIEAIKEIYTTLTKKEVKIVAISTFDSEHLIVEALEAGARGYVIKNAQRGAVINAIKTTYDNAIYYCNSTSSRLVRLLSASNFNPYAAEIQPLFSEVERQVIRLIIEEKSSDEIGEMLFLSKRTVDRLRSGILTKMNVKTPAGVTLYAVKTSLYIIKPPGNEP